MKEERKEEGDGGKRVEKEDTNNLQMDQTPQTHVGRREVGGMRL